MNIQQSAPLNQHSTMRLGGQAAYLTEVHNREEVAQAVTWAKEHSLRLMMIGDGSNIVWRDEGFDGLILVNKIKGFELNAGSEDEAYVTIGSGENWDSVVNRAVQAGLSGIEALSLIPGTAGATPVQNVGAYGQDISQTLVNLEAYDLQQNRYVSIDAAECEFGYRTSRFKKADRGRFLITSMTLHLHRDTPKPPFYRALQSYLDEHQISNPSTQQVRDAVIAIRQSKLPDPAKIANNGSFFANPIISRDEFSALQTKYPEIPNWPTADGQVKIPAAWLVEQSGFKNFKDAETGMATWPKQPLVLVNESAKSTTDLLHFKQKITDKIKREFGISLEQEPELLP
jgi:UDP-N-acetylmuramate dehydrogenase